MCHMCERKLSRRHSRRDTRGVLFLGIWNWRGPISKTNRQMFGGGGVNMRKALIYIKKQ